MKTVLFICCLVISHVSICQSLLRDSLEKNVKQETCTCLSKKKVEEIDIDVIKSCLQVAMMNNEKLMAKFLVELYGDSANYENGYKYGTELGKKLGVDLVDDCDNYYHFYLGLRAKTFQTYNTDSLKAELVSLNKLDTTKRDINFYIKRGGLYYELYGDQEAFNDAQKVLQFNPQHPGAWLTIALCYLEANMLDNAIPLLEQLSKYFQTQDINIITAVAKRKKREALVNGIPDK